MGSPVASDSPRPGCECPPDGEVGRVDAADAVAVVRPPLKKLDARELRLDALPAVEGAVVRSSGRCWKSARSLREGVRSILGVSGSGCDISAVAVMHRRTRVSTSILLRVRALDCCWTRFSASTAPKLATRRRGGIDVGRVDAAEASCDCCNSGGLAGSGWVVEAGEGKGDDALPSDDGPRSSDMGAASDEAALAACDADVLADGDDHGYGLVLSAGDDATELGRRPPNAIDDRFGCM